MRVGSPFPAGDGTAVQSTARATPQERQLWLRLRGENQGGRAQPRTGLRRLEAWAAVQYLLKGAHRWTQWLALNDRPSTSRRARCRVRGCERNLQVLATCFACTPMSPLPTTVPEAQRHFGRQRRLSEYSRLSLRPAKTRDSWRPSGFKWETVPFIVFLQMLPSNGRRAKPSQGQQ